MWKPPFCEPSKWDAKKGNSLSQTDRKCGGGAEMGLVLPLLCNAHHVGVCHDALSVDKLDGLQTLPLNSTKFVLVFVSESLNGLTFPQHTNIWMRMDIFQPNAERIVMRILVCLWQLRRKKKSSFSHLQQVWRNGSSTYLLVKLSQGINEPIGGVGGGGGRGNMG